MMLKEHIRMMVRDEISKQVNEVSNNDFFMDSYEEHLQESLLVTALSGVAIAAASALGVKLKIATRNARIDRVMIPAFEAFVEEFLPNIEKDLKDVERMTKLLNNTADYDRILKLMEKIEKDLENAFRQVDKFSLDKHVSDEVAKQIIFKWGEKAQNRVQQEIRDAFRSTIDSWKQDRKKLMVAFDERLNSL